MTELGRPMKVLVVDDEDDIRLIVGLNLGLKGMAADEAANGEQALEKIRAGSYDGCVLDLAMPGTDGYTVLETLSREGIIDSLAVVVLSAKGSPHDAIKAMQLGAHAHLTKPFSPAAVADVVQRLAEMTAQQRRESRVEMLRRAGDLERLGMPTV